MLPTYLGNLWEMHAVIYVWRVSGSPRYEYQCLLTAQSFIIDTPKIAAIAKQTGHHSFP